MELDEVDRGMKRDAAGFVEGGIDEHRDLRDEGRKRGDPRGVFIQNDVALRAGEEIEAERVRAKCDGGLGVFAVRDAADFHAHATAHARGSESITRPSTRFMPVRTSEWCVMT